MWRDMERRAARLGLPFQRPDVFPANGLGAARIMTAALEEPWCGDFARAVFESQFSKGQNIADTAVLRNALGGCGVSPDTWIKASQDPVVKESLRANTALAQERGLFGAPSFLVGTEVFWGDDRLEDAIHWVKCKKRVADKT